MNNWLILGVLGSILPACSADSTQLTSPSAPATRSDESSGCREAAAPETLSGLQLTMPSHAAPGRAFPVMVSAADGSPLVGTVQLRWEGGSTQLTLYRGKGSAQLRFTQSGLLEVEASLGAWEGRAYTEVGTRTTRSFAGTLTGEQLRWDAQADISLQADVSVPSGSVLTVGPGTAIWVAPGASIVVRGAIEIHGEAEAPVLLAGASPSPWGGLELSAGAEGVLANALFVGAQGTGDNFGHSDSAPVVRVIDSNLKFQGGGVFDSIGKAFGSRNSIVSLSDLIVTRCDTGGEFIDSTLLLSGSHFLEIPDGDGLVADNDNDGLYMNGSRVVDGVPQWSTISHCVFSQGEDDGIDHNGAELRVEDSWVEGFEHEGIAASFEGHLEVVDTVVRACEQGIEAGYGTPQVTVEHCLLTDNEVGLRFGDSYDWGAEGHIEVTHSVLIGNSSNNVLNYTHSLGGSFEGGIRIRCSMIDEPDLTAIGEEVNGGRKGNVGRGQAAVEGACLQTTVLPGEQCAPVLVGTRSCL